VSGHVEHGRIEIRVKILNLKTERKKPSGRPKLSGKIVQCVSQRNII
jgi:hypothetical protein